jgi:hypothetical protein
MDIDDEEAAEVVAEVQKGFESGSEDSQNTWDLVHS